MHVNRNDSLTSSLEFDLDFPLAMVLDQTGCEGLLIRVKELKPKLHVFGHVREGCGIKEGFGVKFVNASVLDENYRLRL